MTLAGPVGADPRAACFCLLCKRFSPLQYRGAPDIFSIRRASLAFPTPFRHEGTWARDLERIQSA